MWKHVLYSLLEMICSYYLGVLCKSLRICVTLIYVSVTQASLPHAVRLVQMLVLLLWLGLWLWLLHMTEYHSLS